MASYIKEKSRTFYCELLFSRFFLTILAAYILLKAISNIAYGASYFTAFRSGIMGVFMYLTGLFAIHLASGETDDPERTDGIPETEDKEETFQIEHKKAKYGLILSYVYFIFLLITVMDNLQRKEILSGNPVLSYLPGYDWLLSVIGDLSQFISNAADFILPDQIRNIIAANLFYVLIPLLLFKLLGYRFSGLFSFKNTRASWPVVGIYLVMFIANGMSAKRIWGFVYSLLYPALCEEFFHRGIVFRSASNRLKSLPYALAMGTIAFSLMHFPDFFFRVYGRNLLMTLSNMGDLFLFGLLMAYGFKKTGTLLPWILIHALSDSLYL